MSNLQNKMFIRYGCRSVLVDLPKFTILPKCKVGPETLSSLVSGSVKTKHH